VAAARTARRTRVRVVDVVVAADLARQHDPQHVVGSLTPESIPTRRCPSRRVVHERPQRVLVHRLELEAMPTSPRSRGRAGPRGRRPSWTRSRSGGTAGLPVRLKRTPSPSRSVAAVVQELVAFSGSRPAAGRPDLQLEVAEGRRQQDAPGLPVAGQGDLHQLVAVGRARQRLPDVQVQQERVAFESDAVDMLMPMWWNENPGRDTGMTRRRPRAVPDRRGTSAGCRPLRPAGSAPSRPRSGTGSTGPVGSGASPQ